jgi:DNA replication and repair protein RecF
VIVRQARLWNVRCHVTLEVGLGPGLTLVVGGNGAGKSSVLEAVHFVLRGSSPRTASPRDLIRHGADYLRVEVDLVEEEGGDEARVVRAAAALDASADKRATRKRWTSATRC